MPLNSSEDESDDVSESSATVENGNTNKKLKLQEKDKPLLLNEEKKVDVPKIEKPVIALPDQMAKEINNKAEKITTVRDMIRAQRDALKTSSHANKGSKSTSSATSDDSSSSDSDSSDSSSDAEADVELELIRDNDVVDATDSLNSKTTFDKLIENVTASPQNPLNKIQTNGTSPPMSNNIPPEIDIQLIDGLTPETRDLITKLIENSKNLKDCTGFQPELLGSLYEYVFYEITSKQIVN